MHGQNAVTISMGNKKCGMFYGVETESMISHIQELRLIRLSATNIYREDTSVLRREIPDSTYEIRDQDIDLLTAYNDWKLAFLTQTNQRWMMYNVMLVWDRGEHYERLAIGKLEQSAWGSCSPKEERVRLNLRRWGRRLPFDPPRHNSTSPLLH